MIYNTKKKKNVKKKNRKGADETPNPRASPFISTTAAVAMYL